MTSSNEPDATSDPLCHSSGTKMQAVILQPHKAGSKLHVASDIPLPTPAPGEVRLKVILAGICGTDLELLSGYKQLKTAQILGHEFVATVSSYASDVPSSRRLPIGTRVVSEINCVSPESESRTAFARAQDPCRTAVGIFGRPGAFAEYLCVPLENVHVVPSNLSDEVAVFTEPVAAACQILEQDLVPPFASVAVLGAGRLGWLVASVLKACRSNVTLLSRGNNKERDERLASALEVPFCVLRKEEHSQAFDVVVDCTGSPDGFTCAVELVRPRGTIVLKSTTAHNEKQSIDLTPVVVKEIKIVGSRCGPFKEALRLLENEGVNPKPLIDYVFKESEAAQAFEKAQSPGVLKVLLRYGEA